MLRRIISIKTLPSIPFINGKRFYWIRRLIQRNQLIENQGILYAYGEPLPLNYRVITEKHAQYLKNLVDKSQISDFESLVSGRVLAEIPAMTTYDQMHRYFQVSHPITNQFLLNLHQQVLSCCDGHISHLCALEMENVKSVVPEHKCKAIDSFVAELDSPLLKNTSCSWVLRDQLRAYRDIVVAEEGEKVDRPPLADIIELVQVEELQQAIPYAHQM